MLLKNKIPPIKHKVNHPERTLKLNPSRVTNNTEQRGKSKSQRKRVEGGQLLNSASRVGDNSSSAQKLNYI